MINLESKDPFLSFGLLHEMHDFLSNNNIINCTSMRNETTQEKSNKLLKERTKPINQDFAYNLIGHITQTNRPKIPKMRRVLTFRN